MEPLQEGYWILENGVTQEIYASIRPLHAILWSHNHNDGLLKSNLRRFFKQILFRTKLEQQFILILRKCTQLCTYMKVRDKIMLINSIKL